MSSSVWSPYCTNVKPVDQIWCKPGYQIIQSNGQRVYSPSADSGISPPPRGTEIFIGNLPPDLFEDEIIPLFSQNGPIYNLRLMVDFFGRNRGYAFIRYFSVEDAHAAVAAFDKFRIRKRSKIAVSISVDNRRLFIGNVPRYMTQEQLQSHLERLVEGIVEVILYREPYDDRFNRGFVFVEFQTHRLAAIARRQLSPGNLVIWDQAIFVDWADPLPFVDPDVMKRITKLYLSNIPSYLTSENVKNVVLDLVPERDLVKVHKMSTYAFVHFGDRKIAEDAYQKLIGLRIGTNVINVEWARPIEFSKNFREGKAPQNFCRSVPPTLRRLVTEEVEKRNRPNRMPSFSSCLDESGSGSAGTTEGFEVLDFSALMIM